jgi:SAM-dependent methyltransferase
VADSSPAGTPHEYYDGTPFWNDLPPVLAHLCRRATGDPSLWWMDYVKRRYATPARRCGLVIGCGNGWVERDLYDRGVAREFDAFDVSPAYVEQARAAAAGRPLRYLHADFRRFQAPRQYDLIVNVAALHHAQYLHRIVDVVASALTGDGIFVNWDYVGPDRNQYAPLHVGLMEQANRALPERFRSPYCLHRSLREAIADDPTEAVHAAEILPTVRRRFEILEEHSLGGGIAYHILWNNVREFARDDAEARLCAERLLQMDADLTDRGVIPSLFAFFVCRPRAGRRPLGSVVARYLAEPGREFVARLSGGWYPAEIRTHPRAVLREALARLRRRLRRSRALRPA